MPWRISPATTAAEPAAMREGASAKAQISSCQSAFFCYFQRLFRQKWRGQTALNISRSGERGAATTTSNINPVFRGML
jgi:hypothetical protein